MSPNMAANLTLLSIPVMVLVPAIIGWLIFGYMGWFIGLFASFFIPQSVHTHIRNYLRKQVQKGTNE